MIPSANPLITVFRLAHRQGENFTTDAFASLLAELDAKEPEVARDFAAWLWDVPPEAVAGRWRIGTQNWMSENREIPDLCLETDQAKLLIEVKIGGDAEPGQLAECVRHLEDDPRAHRRLVSLTGREAQIELPSGTIPRLWNDIAVRLRRHLKGSAGCRKIEKRRCRFAVKQLDEFLQHQQLTFDAIRSPLSAGIRKHLEAFKGREAESPLLVGKQRTLDRLQGVSDLKPLHGLMLLLRTILEGLPGAPQVTVGSSGGEWFGLNINLLEFLCMIELPRPDVLVLERWEGGVNRKSWDGARGKQPYWQNGNWRWRDTLDLAEVQSPSGTGFFEMDEADQRQILTDFLTAGLAYGRKLEAAAPKDAGPGAGPEA